jgi:enoyl-CoA hydratase/carnithine racemase
MMVDYSSYQHIVVHVEDSIATVTLNRPDSLNAVNPRLLTELGRIFYDLADDNSVDIIILTGAGRAFCAGGDVKAMGERNAGDEDHEWAVATPGKHPLVYALLDLEKPIIAAVNGDAVGLGATMALLCDIVIASENARFGDPHVKVGLVPGDGGAVIFTHLVGTAKAKELLLIGDLISANEAERIGLISHVVPRDELMPTAMKFANKLAANPKLTVRWTKLSINKRLKEDTELMLELSSGLEWLSVKTDDHSEAVAAALEKRAPRYKGR